MSVPPRIYISGELSENAAITLSKDQSHYLTRVMRLGEGAPLRVFNGKDGEWNAEISAMQGKSCEIRPLEQTREQAEGSDLWLLFAPLKKARTDFIVEKAAELGASAIYPVITERTRSDRVKVERLQATALEASEQTERLDVPQVHEAAKLVDVLAGWDVGRQLIFADEAGDDSAKVWGSETGRAEPLANALTTSGQQRAAILIGPEGGFAPEERAQLRSLDFVMPVTLGPRILRAETAAVAALTIWQSVVGDWR